MCCHLTLERLAISQLVLLLTCSEARTPASNPNQVFFVDCIANIKYLDNFTFLASSLLLH